MKELFYTRRFLNRERHNAGAHVLGSVEMDGSEVKAMLTIADCSRSVTLDLDLWQSSTAADRRNGRHKVAVLRRAVDEFAAAVEQAYGAHEAAQRRTR